MELDQARARVAKTYDPELWRSAGHRLIDLLTTQLRSSQECRGAVLPWREPQANVDDALAWLQGSLPADAQPEQVVQRFSETVALMLQRGHNLHDPRYIGHQVPAPVPLAGLFDAVGSTTNQPMAIYDMGPWATAAEWALVETLGQCIGWPAGTFAGLATHGGSLANLTALLAARNITLHDSWERGVAAGGKSPVLLVHADTHYSIGRSAGVLGLGTSSVLRVGIDAQRRMDPECLDRMLTQCRQEGRPVVAVVACSCSTPVGAFDPLPAIADCCERHGVWLHVDAAHGGSACLSSRQKHLVAGLERADSIVWDAHKMLFMPALCAFVFFRNRDHRFEAFRQEAPYLFDPSAPGLAEFDSGLRTVECTKRAAAFGLWGVWSLFGPQLFADLVDLTFGLGRVFYDKLQAAPDFEAVNDPDCNIVVFRYIPAEMRDAPRDRLGQFQLELRRHLIQSGEFYIVSTKIEGCGAMRVTIINPLTTPAHLDQLLDAVRRHGRALLDAAK